MPKVIRKPNPSSTTKHSFAERLEIFYKIFMMLVTVIGGIWIYYQFSSSGTSNPNLQLAVSAETMQYSESSKLVVIHVKPKNIGKIPIDLSFNEQSKDFLLNIKNIPKNQKDGLIDIENVPELYSKNISKRYSYGYVLEPGVEYDEIVLAILPLGSYLISANIDFDDNTQINQELALTVN